MGLPLLLFVGLAEHILVELRARLSYDDELGSLLDRNPIFLLMTACGKNNSNLLLENGGASIFECLQQFSVGTDLSKSCRRIQARTTQREYCLLRNFQLKNPLTAAANLITSSIGKKCIDINNNDNNGDNDNNNNDTDIATSSDNNDDDDVDDDNTDNINNEPQQSLYEMDIDKGIGTTERKEYKTIQYSIEGLNQHLCNHHRNLLTKSHGGGILIGFSLLQHRSNFDFDMTTKCDSDAAFATEWKNALCTGRGCRYSPAKKVSPAVASTNATSTTTPTKARNTSKR